MPVHESIRIYAPLIYLLLSLLSFCLSYAASFVLFMLAKTPATKIVATFGLLAAFVYEGIELYIKSHGQGLLVMMPSGCVGVIVADVRTKLRDAKASGDSESVKGWSKTQRILMTIMLPIALVVALSAGLR
jgi:hypothetical protein